MERRLAVLFRGCDVMENCLLQALLIPAARRRPGCVSTFCGLQLLKFSPQRMSCDVWLTAHTALLHTWSAWWTRRMALTTTWLSANGSCRAITRKTRGARCLPHTGAQRLRVTQLNCREHWRHSALRWNGMESCLSYNAIQATALAACGGVPVTLSGQQTESLFPLPRHVSLTWSPSVSSCSRLALTLL